MFKCGITGSTSVMGKFLIRNLPLKFFKFEGRVENKRKIKKWIDSNHFDLIIHLAAIVPTERVNKNYKKALRVNYLGTKNIVDCINKSKNKPFWFFFSSTSHVYGAKGKKNIIEKQKLYPYSKYGYTKFLAENYIKKNLKIDYTIARIFSFTEKKQLINFLIPSLVNKIKRKEKTIANLNHFRDFIHIKDICSAINILWNKRAKGIFNIGSGKKIYLKNLAMIIDNEINKKNTIKFKDNDKPTYLIANIQKLKNLGWKPKYGINKIVKDYLN